MAKNSGTVVVLAMAMALVAMSAWGVQETEAACAAIALDSCLSAAQADVPPETACCTALAAYTPANGIACVCEAAVNSMYFVTNSPQYAVMIPEKCSLTYPKDTKCAGVDIPGGQ